MKALIAQYPNDKVGNLALAQRLWGYNLWTRAEMLRGLVTYFESVGITDQPSLKEWATNAYSECCFKGKVKGLGPAVFNWIRMRQGVETIKPDVHVMRFVETTIGRPVDAEIAVSSLTCVAKELGIVVYKLDWAIWETGRNSN